MQQRYQKRSWFFVFRGLWFNNPLETRFLAGLVTGTITVVLVTLFLMEIIIPLVSKRTAIVELGGEICEEMACLAPKYPSPESKRCVSGLRTACVNVTLRIEASRRLVVNQTGKIVRIYSNTDPETREFRIFASYQDGGKDEIALTAEILEQYNRLEPVIEWNKRGLVYEYRPNLAKKQ
ncbi:MAG: hypothetical protein COY66_06855 [Candidatus Kerfeldbacteria bacterium CG_4_10_14_0_8_um_filter_42_10]|uniref:Uncharacterized protein n=1 Tax=Candidatus Kerfeldbacteria bacterium CG_4_10_14_0_8_um_filter_42_10 TaxID=2014248 RepID=A0A2M7RFB4_9BACT|nr:MAG: hypothetical protein COY66_06855 [Candidatus Kerfeldbacteria bacterium CG_4_10_14_0_8_um_filter_42_10]